MSISEQKHTIGNNRNLKSPNDQVLVVHKHPDQTLTYEDHGAAPVGDFVSQMAFKNVESQVSLLNDQMVKLLSYLEKIQATGLSSDDRGRRVGADVSLDFFSTSTSASTKVTLQQDSVDGLGANVSPARGAKLRESHLAPGMNKYSTPKAPAEES